MHISGILELVREKMWRLSQLFVSVSASVMFYVQITLHRMNLIFLVIIPEFRHVWVFWVLRISSIFNLPSSLRFVSVEFQQSQPENGLHLKIMCGEIIALSRAHPSS